MNAAFLENVSQIPSRFTEQHGWFLYGLVRYLRPAVVLETGTCHGYCTAFLAQALIDCGGLGTLFTVDYYKDNPPHATANDLQVNRERLQRITPLKNLHVMQGEALATIRDLSNAGRLDHLGLAIFDDLHTPEQVAAEIDLVIPHLVEFGCYGGHDCFNTDFPLLHRLYKEKAKQYGFASLWTVHSCGYVVCQKPFTISL